MASPIISLVPGFMSTPKKPQQESDPEDQSKKIQHLIERGHQFFSEMDAETPSIETQSPHPRPRYEIEGLIGAGTMGEVYKAHENQLQRTVALKFLKKIDPSMVSQFLREARLQARVEHDHVCHVYETGEMNGQPFISMQFVNGPSLSEASARMTLEEKLLVMQTIADAVHAAHAQGLIHRDLKPANVLVEDRVEGWHPYVMDFGLARDLEHPGATRTGIIVGSPCYMAPEQARGKIRNLDRRTDVYALGATLYELLCGEPPFYGGSGTEVLVKILQQEATPLRRKNPAVPRELETIVMKCLEKDAGKRYPSARSFSEDITRYLNGDPIHARPQSWLQKGISKIKKHALLSGIIAAAILAVSVLATLWLNERWRSIEQARLAQSFGQEASQIKSLVRSAYTLPLHDLSAEKSLIYKKIEAINSGIENRGPIAIGPGFHAIGVAYLELGDYKLAKSKLEKAWKSGYQTPEVALALGRTLGHLYEAELKKANELKGNEREKRLQTITKEFRDPALQYLNHSEGKATDSPALWKGYIHFYDHRFEEALHETRKALKQPWLYEAWMLQGDIHLMAAIEKQQKEFWVESLIDFAKAESEYGFAINIARSDPRLYQRDCERALQVIEVKAKINRSLPEITQDEIISCDRINQVDPSLADGYFQKSRIYFRIASAQADQGIDAKEYFQKSIQEGEQAVKRNSDDPNLYKFITLSYAWLAHLQAQQGQNPIATLEKLIDASKKEGSLHMKSVAYHQMAIYRMETGQDPMADFEKALKGFEQAQIESPESMEHHNRIGRVKIAIAEYRIGQGREPGTLIEEAINHFQIVIQKFPKYPAPHFDLSRAYNIRSSFEISKNRNPEGFLRKALSYADTASKLDPNYAEAYIELGTAYFLQGRYAQQQGNDPSKDLKQALEVLEKTLNKNQSLINGYLKAAEVHMLLAEVNSRNRSTELQRAEYLLDKAHAINSSHYQIMRAKDQIHLMEKGN